MLANLTTQQYVTTNGSGKSHSIGRNIALRVCGRLLASLSQCSRIKQP